jgi:hypothetical protein
MEDFMFAHLCRRVAAFGRWRALSVAPRAVAAAVLGALLAACSQAPQRFSAPDPSDPRAPVARTAYRPVLGSYDSQRPVDPLPWRDQNDRIAPKP